jgi:hypothetical protein
MSRTTTPCLRDLAGAVFDVSGVVAVHLHQSGVDDLEYNSALFASPACERRYAFQIEAALVLFRQQQHAPMRIMYGHPRAGVTADPVTLVCCYEYGIEAAVLVMTGHDVMKSIHRKMSRVLRPPKGFSWVPQLPQPSSTEHPQI